MFGRMTAGAFGLATACCCRAAPTLTPVCSLSGGDFLLVDTSIGSICPVAAFTRSFLGESRFRCIVDRCAEQRLFLACLLSDEIYYGADPGQIHRLRMDDQPELALERE